MTAAASGDRAAGIPPALPLLAGAAAMAFAAALWLWLGYGVTVFFETIRVGYTACFG